MKRSLVVYLLLEVVFILGCNLGGEDCGVLSTSNPSVGDMSARMVRYYGYNRIDPVEEEDTVSFDNLSIWMDVEPIYLSQDSKAGYQRLHACSPVYPSLLDEIRELIIVSSLPLNDTIPAGTDLSEYFSFETLNSREPIRNLSLLNAYFQSDYYFFLTPLFELNETQFIQFDIRLILNNDKVFDLTSNRVEATVSP